MKETNAFWVDKDDQPVILAKILNKTIKACLQIYEFFKSIRKAKRNT